MIKIVPINAYSDNYIWCIVGESRQSVLVDPGDDSAAFSFLKAQGLLLEAIIVTHHHYDHIDGIASLVDTFNCPVFGPSSVKQKYPFVNEVSANSSFSLLGHLFEVLHLPGHTRDHLGYLVNKAHLFAGDVIFSSGCGRVFDGTIEQLHTTFEKLDSLDGDILIYPAHEYTMGNLNFAKFVEPDNPQIDVRIEQAMAQIQATGCTLPVNLAQERLYNPFLRAKNFKGKVIGDGADKLCTTFEIFKRLRALKDAF